MRILAILALLIISIPKLHSQDIFEFEIIGDSYVGNEVDVIVRAKHTEPIKSIWLIQDNDFLNQIKMDCGGSTECELITTVTLDYEGTIGLRSFLWEFPNQAIAEISTSLNFICNEEYCEKDPILVNFVSWMREKAYDEAVISEYFQFMKNGVKRAAMKDFLDNDLVIRLKQNEELTFYDIIPTDANATYTEMGSNEAADCVPSSYWEEFCPNATTADYLFVEKHFERVFGVNFSFNYVRKPTNYTSEIGPITQNTSGTWDFNFIDLNAFESQFERKDIVHYGLETLDGKALNQTSSGPNVSRMWDNVVNWYDIAVYSHEYGHTSGLPHSFISGTNPLELFSLDGIMNSGYAGHTSVFDPLDPMERYALEPLDGYLDDATFAQEYNDGIIETPFFGGTFKDVEPYVESFVIKDETNTEFVLEAVINNSGQIDCSFFNYSITINGSQAYFNRTIENIAPQSPKIFLISIPKNAISGSTNIRLEIDPENLITDEDNENNIADLILASDSNEILESISIYPNPNDGTLNFGSDKKLNVSIYNALGNRVKKAEAIQSVSISELSNGIYFITLNDLSTGELLAKQKITLIKN